MTFNFFLIFFLGIVAADSLKQCTDATLSLALGNYATQASPYWSKCVSDMGNYEEDIMGASMTQAQIQAFLNSTNCTTYFTFVQKAMKSINPPCILRSNPDEASVVTTLDISKSNASQAFALLGSLGKESNTNHNSSSNLTEIPTVVTPAPSCGSGLTIGLVAITTIALVMA